MTTPMDEHIEAALREMTQSPVGTAGLWKRALRSTPARTSGRWAAIANVFMKRPLSSAAMLVIAVGAMIGAAAVSMPALSRARSRANVNSLSVGLDTFQSDSGAYVVTSPSFDIGSAEDLRGFSSDEAWDAIRTSETTPGQFVVRSTTEQPESSGRLRAKFHYDANSTEAEITRTSSTASFQADSTQSTKPQDGRQVIRRATVEIMSPDVRGVFLKAQQLLEFGRGEYVQNSGIRGSAESMTAELTLRIDATRLSDFLNKLRELGEVQSEVLTGEDVTMQVVDLEARLRNEQRVEAEVLQLLESRTDAPLDEILKLRKSLGEIRTRIEQMTGQRERLARLVSLATVLVLIRSGELPAAEPTSLWGGFVDAMSAAWAGGLAYLGGVIAMIVRILLGGLVFWAALVGVILWFRRRMRARS